MIYGQYKTLSGFKRLRDLSFETCFISTNDWMKIAESLPNLERISINNFVMHDLHVSYIIEKCLKLKRLEFGRGLYPETLLDSFVPTPDRQITFQVTQKMAEQLPMTLLKPPSSCIVEVNDAQFMSHPKVLGRFLQTNKAHLYIFGFINNYQSKTMDRMFNLLVTKQVFDKQRHDMDLELRTIISELK